MKWELLSHSSKIVTASEQHKLRKYNFYLLYHYVVLLFLLTEITIPAIVVAPATKYPIVNRPLHIAIIDEIYIRIIKKKYWGFLVFSKSIISIFIVYHIIFKVVRFWYYSFQIKKQASWTVNWVHLIHCRKIGGISIMKVLCFSNDCLISAASWANGLSSSKTKDLSLLVLHADWTTKRWNFMIY